MEPDSPVAAAIWVVAFVIIVILFVRQRRRRRRVGGGGAGMVYDWLNEDQRRAIEIIAEGRAEARDPENRDGNLPDLEDPRRRSRPARDSKPEKTRR